MLAKTRTFLRDLWILVTPYWRSEERWRSGALLAVIVAMNLGTVYVNVLFNEWNKLFYNALQQRNVSAFTHQFIRFGFLAAIFLALEVYRLYLRQMLQIRWRRWLTGRYLGEWLGRKAFYRLQLAGGRTDNPDQRISEDINGFVRQTLVLSLGLLESVVSLASFAGILWVLSGPLSVAGLSIPGYMLWVAIVYAALGSWLTHLVGRPLIGLNFQKQQFEADFRFSLVRLRENAEAVALYGGETQETEGLVSRFSFVVRNWWAIMRQQKRLTWFSSGYGQVAIVFPFIVAAPRYFRGTMQLGGLMQTASAFGQVQTALSWFVEAYTSLVELTATIERLTTFEHALAEARAAPEGRRPPSSSGNVTLNDVDIWLPDGTPLIRSLDLDLPAGARTLVSGPSGCGKSTLFRVVGGIWPFFRGEVSLPADTRFLFLPQNPYLPVSTLRHAITYPDAPDSYRRDDLLAALALCGMDGFEAKLDEEAHWSQRLSPGEQQRLAFARAFLIRPAWLFLDEATSALDETSEANMYEIVLERLPHVSVVSIAHRPALDRFHRQRLAFKEKGRPATFELEVAAIR